MTYAHAWIGLTKPKVYPCEAQDYSCLRQGWNWEDGTAHVNGDMPDSWCNDCPNSKKQPSDAQEQCVSMNKYGWFAMPCKAEVKHACFCERSSSSGAEVQSEEGECPSGWRIWRDDCYLMTSVPTSSFTCPHRCGQYEAKLTSIVDKAENDLIANM